MKIYIDQPFHPSCGLLIEHVRKLLHDFFKFPSVVYKLTGLFPFSINKQNELHLSHFWSVYSALHLVNEFTCLLSYYTTDLAAAYGGSDNDTGSYVNDFVSLVRIISQFYLRIFIFRKIQTLINFHSSISDNIVNLILNTSSESKKNFQAYLGMIKKKTKKLKCASVVIASATILNGFMVGIYGALSMLKNLKDGFNLKEALYLITFVNYTVFTTLFAALPLWISCYVVCLGMTVKIMQDECCLIPVKTLQTANNHIAMYFEEILQVFNWRFPEILSKLNAAYLGRQLILWMVMTVPSAIHMLFATFLIIKQNIGVENILLVILVVCNMLPVILVNIFSFHVLCDSCSNFHDQVN